MGCRVHMALLLDEKDKSVAPNASFSTSLKALGADDVIRIFKRALQPPDDVVVNKDKPTLNLRQLSKYQFCIYQQRVLVVSSQVHLK